MVIISYNVNFKLLVNLLNKTLVRRRLPEHDQKLQSKVTISPITARINIMWSEESKSAAVLHKLKQGSLYQLTYFLLMVGVR